MPETGLFDHGVKIIGHSTTDKGADIGDVKKVLEPMSREEKQLRGYRMRLGSLISNLAEFYLENNPTGDEKTTKLLSESATNRFNFDFLSHLVPEIEGKRDPTAEKRLSDEAKLIARKIAKKFRDAIPNGAKAQFFTAMWESDAEQGNRVNDAVYDKNFRKYLWEATRGKKELTRCRNQKDIALEVVSSTDFHLPSALIFSDESFVAAAQESLIVRTALSQLPKYISLPDCIRFYDDLVQFAPQEARKTNAGKLIQMVADLVPYRSYNLHTAGVPDAVTKQILPDWFHQITDAGVRPDVVGLYAPVTDEEAQEKISSFIQSTKGTFMGMRSLLNIANQTEEQQKATTELYDFMRENRVFVIVGEVKSLLTLNKEDILDLLKKFRQGLGYRIWGIFQQAFSVYAREQNKGGADVIDFTQRVNNLAHIPDEKTSRIVQIRNLLNHPFARPFFHTENTAMLSVVRWPLFRSEWNEKTNRSELKRALTISWEGPVGVDKIPAHTAVPVATVERSEHMPISKLWKEIFLASRTIIKKNSNMERIRRQANENAVAKVGAPMLVGIGQGDESLSPSTPIPVDVTSIRVGRSNAPIHNK